MLQPNGLREDVPVMVSYTYFARCRDGILKIGGTSNLEIRMKGADLYGASLLFALIPVGGGRGCSIESAMHRHFAAARVRAREWYALSNDSLIMPPLVEYFWAGGSSAWVECTCHSRGITPVNDGQHYNLNPRPLSTAILFPKHVRKSEPVG